MDGNPETAKGINRQVEVASPSEDKPLALTRLKYIDGEQLRMLSPLDADGEAIEYQPNEPIILRELPRGSALIEYETYVISSNEPNPSWGNLLVLAQPQANPIRKRRFARVNTVVPVTLHLPTSDTTAELLTTSLGAGGILATVQKGEEELLNPGADVQIELHLPDDEMFELQGIVRRSYTFEREGKKFRSVAIEFVAEGREQQDSLVRYVLTREIQLRTLEIVQDEVPLHQQIEALQAEIVRLQEELKHAHEREEQAAEARRRSDAIILQLTRQVDEANRRVIELQQQRRARWWQFWRR